MPGTGRGAGPGRLGRTDLSHPRLGDALFRAVTDRVGRHHPHLLDVSEEHCRELRVHAAAADFAALPPADRDRLAGRARRAVERLRDLTMPTDRSGHAWAVQHAWNIAETAGLQLLALDPGPAPAGHATP